MDPSDDRLRNDLDRLAVRVYSEEGIPMFLVCEDLAPDETEASAACVALTSLNRDLAFAVRRDADALQRIHPGTPVSDAAKLIEMLADRDFTAGGTGTDL